MSRIHYINLYHDPNNKYHKEKNRALPGSLHVNPGDKVIFIATNSNYILFVPAAGRIFDGYSSDYYTQVKNGEETEPLLINEGKPRIITYAVYCDSGEDFVVGDSSPRIIVE